MQCYVFSITAMNVSPFTIDNHDVDLSCMRVHESRIIILKGTFNSGILYK